MEHRCGYRRAVNVTVTIRTISGLSGQSVLCEVSASGARLKSTLPLPIHSTVHVQFTTRTTEGVRKRVSVEAEVVRQTSNGFGLEWTEFSPPFIRGLYMDPLDTDAVRAEPGSDVMAHRARRTAR